MKTLTEAQQKTIWEAALATIEDSNMVAFTLLRAKRGIDDAELVYPAQNYRRKCLEAIRKAAKEAKQP